MGNLSGIMQQLKKERDRVERELSGLNAALAAFVNVYAGKSKPTTGRKRRKMSVAARKKIATAQRARWAKARRESRPMAVGAAKTAAPAPAKRTMSASARRKIAAAQRARWAKVKAEQKKAA
jgi:hypothetical protein